MRFFAAEADARQIPNPSRPPPPSRSTATASAQAGQSNKTKREYLLFLLTHHPPTRFASLFEPCSWLEPSARALRCRGGLNGGTPSLSLRGITKNPHNTHTHPRRTARQRSEAGRRGSQIRQTQQIQYPKHHTNLSPKNPLLYTNNALPRLRKNLP